MSVIKELLEMLTNGHDASDFGWWAVIGVLFLTGINISVKKVRGGELTASEAFRYWLVIIGAVLFFIFLYWVNKPTA